MSPLTVRAGVCLVRRVRAKRKISISQVRRYYVWRHFLDHKRRLGHKLCPHCLSYNVKGPSGIEKDGLRCRNCDWFWTVYRNAANADNAHMCSWEDPKEDRHYHYRPDLSKPCLRGVDRVPISFGPYM